MTPSQALREAVARRIAYAHGDPIVAGHLALHGLCADAACDVIRLVLDEVLKCDPWFDNDEHWWIDRDKVRALMPEVKP